MADKKKVSALVSEPVPAVKAAQDKPYQNGSSASNGKRSIADVVEPPAKLWSPYFRRAFMARGCGEFKDDVKLISGTGTIASFSIIGTFSDGAVLAIQVWAEYAKEFADLFA